MPDATSFSPWGAAAQAASGLLSTGIGLLQRGAANRWLKKNQQPEEAMPTEIRRNQELATIRANTGLPSEQYNTAMKNIQNQQLMALRGASLLGGGKALGILGGINQYGNDAVGNLDARNAQARLQNEGQLINVNNQVAGWKSRLFDTNVRQKWLRQYNQMMNQQGAGNQNIVGGVDKLFAAGGQLGASGGFGGGGGVNTGLSGRYVTDTPLERTQVGGDVNPGDSPANTFGTIPYNPAIYPNPNLRRFLNRPR